MINALMAALQENAKRQEMIPPPSIALEHLLSTAEDLLETPKDQRTAVAVGVLVLAVDFIRLTLDDPANGAERIQNALNTQMSIMRLRTETINRLASLDGLDADMKIPEHKLTEYVAFAKRLYPDGVRP